jgi:hypothetical protein
VRIGSSFPTEPSAHAEAEERKSLLAIIHQARLLLIERESPDLRPALEAFA